MKYLLSFVLLAFPCFATDLPPSLGEVPVPVYLSNDKVKATYEWALRAKANEEVLRQIISDLRARATPPVDLSAIEAKLNRLLSPPSAPTVSTPVLLGSNYSVSSILDGDTGEVSRVEFQVSIGEPIAAATTAPWVSSFKPTVLGPVQISARVVLKNGSILVAPPTLIEVREKP